MAQNLQSISDFSRLRLLVHVHVFYPQLYPELKACLENLRGLNFDLYVSFVEDHPEIEADILTFKPDAVIFRCPNRGYDIAPFVDMLNRVDLGDYDFVVKLHTKRDMPIGSHIYNLADVSGTLWREKLYSFISQKENLYKALKAFDCEQTLGMVGHRELILENSYAIKLEQYKHRTVFVKSQKLIQSLVKDPNPRNKSFFVAGAMFMVRAKLLEPLKTLNLNYESFPSMQAGKNELDLAHVLERLIGWLVTSTAVEENGSHYKISDPYTSYTPHTIDLLKKLYCNLAVRSNVFRKTCRFLLRVEYQQGFRIVKVLKIPVYRAAIHLHDSNFHMDQGAPK